MSDAPAPSHPTVALPAVALPTVAPGEVAPAVLDEVRRLYAALDDEVRSLGVGCWVHGNCCDFTRVDHRLYASSVELAYVRAKHPPPPKHAAHDTAQDTGPDAAGNSAGKAAEAAPSTNEALCPFWTNGRCGEREGRPLGCRTYFCDPRFRLPLQDLYERYLQKLRAIATQHSIPWSYEPFVAAMRAPASDESA